MHVQRSAKIAGYIDWLFDWNVLSLREPISILSGKGKGLTFEGLFRSPFTELAFEFITRKSLC